jgi:hypothetical protein
VHRWVSASCLVLAGCGSGSGGAPDAPRDNASAYDRRILSDAPILYLTMATPESGAERDQGGRGHTAQYAGTLASTAALPNGDLCARFDGRTQYLEVPDADDLSMTTTRRLTIEAWMRPDVLELPTQEGSGYVHWMGKGESGQHEYVLRLYSLTNAESRPSRISGYAFNLAGNLGSGSYFQDAVTAGEWIHVAVAFNLDDLPTETPPGSVKIYKNGVLRDTTPLSQFQVVPANGTAPLRIGTRDRRSFFPGAIGKVALYDRELNAATLLAHSQEMTARR